jgi:hypothetical protein
MLLRRTEAEGSGRRHDRSLRSQRNTHQHTFPLQEAPGYAIVSGLVCTALRRQGRSVAWAAGLRHRRPRLRHRTHRRGAASAASRPPQARARVVDNVRLSAQLPADWSVQQLRPRRRWTAPTHGWAARRRSGPPSARQRARTDAAPCLTSMPPTGLKKEGTGTAALCPCHWVLPPPFPLVRGLRQSLSLLHVCGCAAPAGSV